MNGWAPCSPANVSKLPYGFLVQIQKLDCPDGLHVLCLETSVLSMTPCFCLAFASVKWKEIYTELWSCDLWFLHYLLLFLEHHTTIMNR